MKKRLYLLTLVVILVILGTYTAMNFKSMPKEIISNPVVNAWSEPTNGLSGRLLVEFEDLKPGLRHAVNLELRNDSFYPIAVINQPRVHAELFDSSGNAVSSLGFPMGGPIPGPQWAVIPGYAYVGFRLDMQTVGVPTREQEMVLIAVGGKTWRVKAGKYVLKSALVFIKKEDGPQNQWGGELELPPVEVVVTPEMLAM